MTTKRIVTLPDNGLTSISQESRCKHWIKILTGVDRSQSNGYAFQGNFAHFESTVELDEGAWVMSFVEDRAGSGRLRSIDVTLYQLRNGDLAIVEKWTLGPQAGWALHVRDKIANYMETKPEPVAPNVDELLAEREQLLARLAEIDAQLPEPEGTEVTTRQAAITLGVSIRTVQRWAATGKVQAVKDNTGRWIITITIGADK